MEQPRPDIVQHKFTFGMNQAHTNEWLLLGSVFAIVLLVSSFVWGFVRPRWLTQNYGPELAQAVQRFFEVSYSPEGATREEILAQVATGRILEG